MDNAQIVVDTLGKITTSLEGIVARQEKIEKSCDELSKARYPHGFPASNIRTGESPNSSRPFSLARLLVAISRPEMADQAKLEIGISKRLQEASAGLGWIPSTGVSHLIPFAPSCLVEDLRFADGHTAVGYPADLVKECRECMILGSEVDIDELRWIAKRLGGEFAKDLSSQTATSGGTLVGLAAQGQLIDLLRPQEVFSRAGAQEITLPPQGSIRFPRDASDPTIDAFGEGETISESTPTTGELILTAKKYSGLVDIPVELMRFATSINVEAWLRNKFIRRLSIKTDRDQIDGTGGTRIKGIVTYSGINTVIASTVGANGDTLEAQDPSRLMAAIENDDARLELGAFFAIRPQLWQRVTHRRADAVTAGDKAGAFLFNTDRDPSEPIKAQLEGFPVIKSTSIPNNRTKGSGTDLTLLLAGVGPSWIIGRAGVAEIDMTTSDASKFQQGLNTMRGIIFMDAGPEHEEEFGMIDDLLETT
jgi:HK97 family phage major capsid protein